MKKIFYLFIFCTLSLNSFAFSVGDVFIKNSRFWQNKLSLEILTNDDVSTGLNFSLTDHKYRKENIYSFYLPIMMKTNFVDFIVEPFFYPNTNNDASAYGANLLIKGMLQENEIDSSYVMGYLKAAFANQKANIDRTGTPVKENFKEFVFEGGLNYNLANIFSFDINGNIFTYKDKVKDIINFGGVMNQRDIADLGTIDYVLNFPLYSVGGAMTWISNDNNAKSSISYKYINYEQNLIAHSVMVQTVIPVNSNFLVNFIYNHLFENHGVNRDLFGVGLNYLF